MLKCSLTGKVALVTGGARRIGAEIINELHAAGMNIVLHYHTSKAAAQTLCQQLNQKRNDSVVMLSHDFANINGLPELVQQAILPWQRLDVLVNNASQFYPTKLGEINETSWNELMCSNLKAPFFLSQAAAPFLAKNQGCIINITDTHADQPLKNYAVYCLAKSALAMMTKVLAKELGPKIRVNAVAPGAIIWPEGENELTESIKQKIIEKTLLRVSGSPHDIAKAVLFFVRDAYYVTGETLRVDGGRFS